MARSWHREVPGTWIQALGVGEKKTRIMEDCIGKCKKWYLT